MVVVKEKAGETEIIKISDSEYNVDFGNRKKGEYIGIVLNIPNVVRTEVTCGCTTIEPNNGNFEIIYSRNRLGTINQRATFHLNNGNKIKINVLGTVS